MYSDAVSWQPVPLQHRVCAAGVKLLSGQYTVKLICGISSSSMFTIPSAVYITLLYFVRGCFSAVRSVRGAGWNDNPQDVPSMHVARQYFLSPCATPSAVFFNHSLLLPPRVKTRTSELTQNLALSPPRSQSGSPRFSTADSPPPARSSTRRCLHP